MGQAGSQVIDNLEKNSNCTTLPLAVYIPGFEAYLLRSDFRTISRAIYVHRQICYLTLLHTGKPYHDLHPTTIIHHERLQQSLKQSSYV